MTLAAVIWDFGGVVSSSPFEAFNRFEATHGLPRDFIRGVNATNPDHNAWALFERSELDAAGFDAAFLAESSAKGHPVRGADVLPLLGGDIRPRVVEALRICRQHVKIGCITNNVASGDGAGMSTSFTQADQARRALSLVHHVLESSTIGIRKPDPRIYALMCEALGVEPSACIYLDDLGVNLKPAAAMGMRTIKVTGEDQLLTDLAAATGFVFP